MLQKNWSLTVWHCCKKLCHWPGVFLECIVVKRAKDDLYLTLYSLRVTYRFYSSKGDPLGVKGLKEPCDQTNTNKYDSESKQIAQISLQNCQFYKGNTYSVQGVGVSVAVVIAWLLIIFRTLKPN